MYYAVIDTNVLVSALMSKKQYESAPLRIVNYMFGGELIPIFNEEILAEYNDVLHRPKFHFTPERIQQVINKIKEFYHEIYPPNRKQTASAHSF